jgi:hypothetical protein
MHHTLNLLTDILIFSFSSASKEYMLSPKKVCTTLHIVHNVPPFGSRNESEILLLSI